MNLKVLLVIPAFNEAKNIERVVDNLIENFPQYDYLIINDCSKDNTLEICQNRNYNVLNLPINIGLGTVVQTGFKYAMRNGYDYVIQFDGDGQHRPEYIQSLLDKAVQGNNIVIGSRFIEEKKATNLRNLGSHIITNAIQLVSGIKLTDPTSGFKCYDKVAMDHYTHKMNVSPEADDLVYLIKKKKIKVVEVPVEMDDRIYGESYFNLINAGKFMLNMLISILIIQRFRKD